MAGLSNVSESVHLPLNMPVYSYMGDHCFEGRTVLPAVEAMRTLCAAVKGFEPRADIATIQEARFDKFLVIPRKASDIEAECRLTVFDNGRIEAVLQKRTLIEKAGFTRVKEHARAAFYLTGHATFEDRLCLQTNCAKNGIKVTRKQIYDQLVPFGPAYHNINADLKIYENGAVADILAPTAADADREPSVLGSPFVLDAAFHAACVWGQRFCDVVAFPVGIEKRVVFQPTQSGQQYTAHVFAGQSALDSLCFDIDILDQDGCLHEFVRGVHMQDVSAGRMRPPDWIKGDHYSYTPTFPL